LLYLQCFGLPHTSILYYQSVTRTLFDLNYTKGKKASALQGSLLRGNNERFRSSAIQNLLVVDSLNGERIRGVGCQIINGDKLVIRFGVTLHGVGGICVIRDGPIVNRAILNVLVAVLDVTVTIIAAIIPAQRNVVRTDTFHEHSRRSGNIIAHAGGDCGNDDESHDHSASNKGENTQKDEAASGASRRTSGLSAALAKKPKSSNQPGKTAGEKSATQAEKQTDETDFAGSRLLALVTLA